MKFAKISKFKISSYVSNLNDNDNDNDIVINVYHFAFLRCPNLQRPCDSVTRCNFK